MSKNFGDFDTTAFWQPSDYATEEYVGRPLDDATVQAVEQELGYKLPASYVELMKVQNGGIPRRTCHRTTWAPDHVALTGLYSVGRDKPYSLCGDFRTQFWVDEWGYPPIGIYFADCPSAGHDMIALDYRACGPTGEPPVVHVDQEWNYQITTLAPTFEAFIRGLEDESSFAS